MRIYTSYAKTEAEHQALARVTAGDEVWVARGAPPTEEDRAAFLRAEVAFGAFPGELLGQAKSLRWVQLPGVGIDKHRDLDWAGVAGRVVCTNSRRIFVEPMAQTALAGILALHRGIDQLVLLKEKSDWQKPAIQYQLTVLKGANVLLLGAGEVAKRLRALLEPFGCAVTFYGRTSGDIHTPAELDEALPKADIVCGALPDTLLTRGLLGAERIARFKPGAIFVNLGRGSLVDEAALVAALRSGRLGGAVLDVTVREPIPPQDTLWKCPRTILTQHTSAGSPEMALDPIAVFGENLARYRAGQPLQNIVNWAKGY